MGEVFMPLDYRVRGHRKFGDASRQLGVIGVEHGKIKMAIAAFSAKTRRSPAGEFFSGYQYPIVAQMVTATIFHSAIGHTTY